MEHELSGIDGQDYLGALDPITPILGKARQALRTKRPLNLPRGPGSKNGPDCSLEVTLMYESYHDIRGFTILRYRDLEMIYVGANVRRDSSHVRATVGGATIDNKNAHRFVEFTYPVDKWPYLQLSAERYLEEAVLDLVIGEVRPPRATSYTNFSILGRRLTDRSGKRDSGIPRTRSAGMNSSTT